MKRRRKKSSGLGIVAFVVLIFCGIVSYSRVGLAQEQVEAQRNITRIESDIAKQNQRAVDIKEQKEYQKTRQYIEEIARERLGLVYKDEIIFEPKE